MTRDPRADELLRKVLENEPYQSMRWYSAICDDIRAYLDEPQGECPCGGFYRNGAWEKYARHGGGRCNCNDYGGGNPYVRVEHDPLK